MNNRIERSPFLEEDVDELIGYEPRRRANSLVDTGMGDGRGSSQRLDRDIGW